MPQSKHIVIIAGEESGDIHAAEMVHQLQENHSPLRFSGIGGRHMQNAGVELISDLASYGVTGLSEVLRHARVIKAAFKAIKAHLEMHKPELLILVDYPGFNLRLARFAKSKGIRVLYYISPQIWAWKAGRIETIRQCVDHMAVILPFEKAIYDKENIPASFVGHPLVNKIKPCIDQDKDRQSLGLPTDKQVVALLPGSRRNEIDHLLPVMIKAAEILIKEKPNLHFALPMAQSLKPELIENYFKNSTLPYTLIKGQATKVVACSDCVIVASGTASLECALLEKPMCIIYKSSLITYIAAMKVIKVKYLGLCNLLKNEMIVPELLQYDCNPIELSKIALQLLDNSSLKHTMQTRLRQLRESLSFEQADCTIVELIQRELEEEQKKRLFL